MGLEKIKSFEISEDTEKVGDILSRDRKSKREKLKVGLMCCGWFEWWQMFPDTDLEKKIKGDSEVFVETTKTLYGDKYDFLYPGMIDTLDAAFDTGEYFKEEKVDVVIIAENTYLTDFIPLEMLDHLPNVPVIIFSTQATRNLPPKMTNLDVIRYEGLVGVCQLVGAFRKMGRDYKVVVGALDDLESYKKLEMHLRALDLIKRLSRWDIGLLGHTFRGMYDLEIDKTKLKGVIGPNFLYIDEQHLIDIWKNITDEEVDAYIEKLGKEIPIESHIVTAEDKRKSVKLGLAMVRLVKKLRLDGLALLGQHYVEKTTKASADFSFYMVEKMGIMTTHEGDVGNLVMKMILLHLSGSLPVFVEFTAFDESTNTIFLTHHGVVDPVHCADISKCRWTPAPEKWDFTGSGLSIEYVAKPGKVTLASLIDDYEGWKILISEGECVKMEQHPCYAPQFFFKPKIDVKEYIRRILAEGVTHHLCLVYGEYREYLELLADYLKIRKSIIPE